MPHPAQQNDLHLPRKLVLEKVKNKDPAHRFGSPDDRQPEQMILVLDPETGKTWGFVVVDNTRRGPGLGGIRVAPDLTLMEVRRLAHAMTLKNSAALLPFGGGKSGLIVDPVNLNTHPGMKRDLIGLFAEALFEIDSYITAPDMGTDEKVIQQIYEIYSERLNTPHHLRGGAGRPPQNGGIPIDDWGLTAHGVVAAIKTVEAMDATFTLKGARVVIQGYGNVGAPTAGKLQQAGALIVGASDIHQALWNSRGLDVTELNRARSGPKGLAKYSGTTEKSFPPQNLDWLLEAPCDILIPAARPDAITARNADRIQCRMVFQGANAPSNKMTEYYLQNHRGIISYSDFIVNVGGVMGCAVELKMNIDSEYKNKVLATGEEGRPYLENLISKTISNNVKTIYQGMAQGDGSDAIFRDEALKLAEECLANPRRIQL